MRAAVVGVVAARAHDPGPPSVDPTEPEIGQHDFEKGSKHGSPLDALPEHITLLDIDLPGDRAPMRADWSPDGKRLIFLDDPIGNRLHISWVVPASPATPEYQIWTGDLATTEPAWSCRTAGKYSGRFRTA